MKIRWINRIDFSIFDFREFSKFVLYFSLYQMSTLRSQLFIFARNIGIILLITAVFALAFEFFREKKPNDKETAEKIDGTYERKLILAQDFESNYSHLIDTLLTREVERLSKFEKITNVKYGKNENWYRLTYNFEGLENLNEAIGIERTSDFLFHGFYVEDNTLVCHRLTKERREYLEKNYLLDEKENEELYEATFGLVNLDWKIEHPNMRDNKTDFFVHSLYIDQRSDYLAATKIEEIKTIVKFNYSDNLPVKTDLHSSKSGFEYTMYGK